MTSPSTITACLIFSLAAATVTMLLGADAAAPSQGEDERPRITLNEDKFDFGKIDEGVVVKHVFQITNKGNAVLKLDEATATCGCTIPRLARKRLKPEESTDLNVSIDTSMKQNAVIKTVFVTSNDPERPTIAIPLSMFVENPHKGLSEVDGVKIFTDQHCASCHVAKGTGKLGRDLYNADCAMCHGPKAEGAVGPALFRPYGNALVRAHITTVTEEGSPEHHSMPGFLDSRGGPLSKEQVVSIVDYLKALSKARGMY